MRYKIENLKDITDSREILKASPKGFSKIMTYIILAFILSIITWSCFAYKEITITASGVVRPNGDINKVSSSLAGCVSEVNVKNGNEVKEGDTLIVLGGEQYKIQKDLLQENLDNKNKMLSLTKKLKDSILENKNKFNKDIDEEKEYSIKYELFVKNLNSLNSQESSYKEQYISDLDSKILSLQSSIDELNINLETVKNQFNSSTIKATCNGVVNMISDLKVGDFVQIGEEIASIVPQDEDGFQVDVYIDNQSIGDIKEGQDVIIELSSLPSREYGYIKSNLNNISIDAKNTEKASYYTAKCYVNEKTLENKKGEVANIKNGMAAQVKIVQRRVKYFRYFLEKLDIWN